MAGLALALATAGPVLAAEEQQPAPLTATSVAANNGTLRIIANDQDGSSHTIVLDISHLSDAQREMLSDGLQADAQASDTATEGTTANRFEGDSTGITTPGQADNIVEIGPGQGMGIGHASSTSNNTMGDISEGLSNQPSSDDDDTANGDGQQNSPNT
jgi:hypothetical protein